MSDVAPAHGSDPVDAAVLPGGPRPLRRLAPPHAPWPATLACDDDGRRCLLVDVALLRRWRGWRARGDGHVAGVIDLVRRTDGHDAVVPACTRRLDDHLRDRAGSAPAAGEIVTLAVSMLRGCAELCGTGAHAPVPHGRWWLCDDGRPMFVCADDDEHDVVSATRGVAGTLRHAGGDGATPLRAALDALDRLLVQPRAVRGGCAAVEDLLFAAATPAPLAAAAAPRRPPAPVWSGAPSAGVPDAGLAATSAAAPRRRLSLPAGVAGAAADALAALRSRMRRGDAAHARRRPVLLAAGLAAVVLAAGLLWPGGSTVARTAPHPSAPAARAPAAPRPPAARRPTTPGPQAASASLTPVSASPSPAPVDVAEGLLRRRAGCADQACRGRLQEDPALRLPPGAIDLPQRARTVSLIDDFGGLAVVRVHPAAAATGTPDQLVVIVRRGRDWLLRDARAVGRPPPS